MLRWRLPIGIVLIASLIGLFAIDVRIGPRAPLLCLFAVLLAIRGAWEMVQLLKTRSFAPNVVLVVSCCTAVVLSNWLPAWFSDNPPFRKITQEAYVSDGGGAVKYAELLPPAGLSFPLEPLSLSVALAAIAMFLATAARYKKPGDSMETLGAELLTLIYIGLFLSLTAQLRWVGFARHVLVDYDFADLGYLPLASVIVVTKCGDTMAYTFGRLFGKKKMAPLLSPGKTWAGAYGAFLGAATGSWAWLTWGTEWLVPSAEPCAWYWAVLYGLIIGLAGMVGDLCESLIKRDVGVKDSAPLLPGFGGVLDLLDSVIFAGPVAYLLWLVLPLVR
jgi:phosphatidate cytidylyltransferase